MEKQYILTVYSAFPILLRFMNILKCGDKKLLNIDFLKKVLKTLIQLFYFIVNVKEKHLINEDIDPFVYEGNLIIIKKNFINFKNN